MIIAAQTAKTPLIAFDDTKNEITICGRSYPEDLHAFWDPALSRIQRLIKTHSPLTLLFDLSYHNSGSTRILINLINFCNSPEASAADVRFVWCYHSDDEQTQEQGEDYRELAGNLPFELMQKP